MMRAATRPAGHVSAMGLRAPLTKARRRPCRLRSRGFACGPPAACAAVPSSAARSSPLRGLSRVPGLGRSLRAVCLRLRAQPRPLRRNGHLQLHLTGRAPARPHAARRESCSHNPAAGVGQPTRARRLRCRPSALGRPLKPATRSLAGPRPRSAWRHLRLHLHPFAPRPRLAQVPRRAACMLPSLMARGAGGSTRR